MSGNTTYYFFYGFTLNDVLYLAMRYRTSCFSMAYSQLLYW